jgi:ATP-dependent DNA helicase RecG
MYLFLYAGNMLNKSLFSCYYIFFFYRYHTVLSQSCATLAGVGPVFLAKLHKCGIETITDLLLYLPTRYQDRTRITAIQDIRVNDYCVIVGRITKTDVKKGKRAMLYCHVMDKTGTLILRFFHFNQYQINLLTQGRWICAFGEIRQFAHQLTMIHPDYQLQDNEMAFVMNETLTPIYPGTEGLSQSRLRQLIRTAFKHYQSSIKQLEWMNESQLQQLSMPSFARAIYLLHNPSPDIAVQSLEDGSHPALQRLAFDELLAQRLSIQFARQHRDSLSAPVMIPNQALISRFLAELPYPLTQAQKRVSDEIIDDLSQKKPMLRLIQGDVGCGKTTVAVIAALHAIANGFQVALMAPTDLLSEQHTYVLTRWLTPLGLTCCRLSGKMKVRARRETLAQVADNSCHLLIGTHALFQEQVKFKQLGLIIIDEQHRFGVEQRLLLQQKGQQGNKIPHQLLMTATPIPRTLAMTQFAYLDVSVIDELPPGRRPVNTAIISHTSRESVIARLHLAINQGRQAYWVCTLIDESEKLQCQAALLTTETLQQRLTGVRVGLVHGKMKAIDKEMVMNGFKRGELDLLVATTVIEVGVDVPNASLMIIENAERLGLAQLHQLRGRVGRGSTQSYCILIYQPPLSLTGSKRLQIMRATSDGFVIAEEDLQLRGSGEVLGTRQAGYRQFKIANLQRDQVLLPEVIRVTKKLVNHNPKLAERITKQWLGDFEQFLHC